MDSDNPVILNRRQLPYAALAGGGALAVFRLSAAR